MKKNILNKKQTLLELLMVVFGSGAIAFIYFLLMSPNEIMPSGLGGIAALLSYVLPLSFGVINFLLNIPLIVLGFRYNGSKFLIYSLIGLVTLSVSLHLFEGMPGIINPWLGAIMGGIGCGAALSLVLVAGGSTGGLDTAAVVINRIWPKWTIGRIMFVINCVVILISGLMFGFDRSLLTILSFYLTSKTIDICYAYGLRIRKGEAYHKNQQQAEG